MARISTHVLDTVLGRPAAGVGIQLFRIKASERSLVAGALTNADGRTDEPLLSGEALEIGVYELVFGAGKYFRQGGAEVPDPPFLDEVVIRFGVAEPAGNYHVPLLLAPFGYTTYRGS